MSTTDQDFLSKKAGSQLAPMPMHGFELAPTNFEEAWRIAQVLASSSFCPKPFLGKPQDVLVCLSFGHEVGLSPTQALQSISVINGKPALYGDGLLAVVRRDASILSVTETIAGEGDARTATCTVRRRRQDEIEETTRSFSIADAKKAKLLGKPGPWSEYTDRMLQMRARSFACRDAASDLLRGIACAEEQEDVRAIEPPKVAVESRIAQMTAMLEDRKAQETVEAVIEGDVVQPELIEASADAD